MIKKTSVFILFFLTGCGESLCENKLLYEKISPKNNYIVSVFERGCGATTPVMTVVSIRNHDKDLKMAEKENWVFVGHKFTTANVSWRDEKNILITYETFDEHPTKKELFDGITISYEKSNVADAK